MFKTISINTKITGLIISIVLVALLAVSFSSYYILKGSAEKRYSETLQVIGRSKAGEIDILFNGIISHIQWLQADKNLLSGLAPSTADTDPIDTGFADEEASIDNITDPFADVFASDEFSESTSSVTDEADDFGLSFDDDPFDIDSGSDGDNPLNTDTGSAGYDAATFISSLKNTYGYEEVIICEPTGLINYSTAPSMQPGGYFIDPDGSTLTKAVREIHFSNIVADDAGSHFVYAAAPLEATTGKQHILLLKIPMKRIYHILADTTGLGTTGELIVARLNTARGRINYMNKTRKDPQGTFKLLNTGDTESKAVQRAVKGVEGAGVNIDDQGDENLAYATYIPSVKWGLVAKIDTEEIYSQANSFFITLLWSGFVILLLAGFISTIYSKYLMNPLISLKKTLELVSNGVLPESITAKSTDEIGSMTRSVNHLTDTLKNTARFAQQIGEGNFSADFKLTNHEDALGIALINMRNNLIEGEKRDKERNRIVTGVAEIGEILRAHDNLEPLGDAVIKYIIGKIGAIQGAFYVVNDDDKSDDTYIEMKASYAYNRKKHLKATFKFAEGLVGQAAAERDTVMRTEIPRDYASITSGILGDRHPTCILIVPLITEEKVYGVVEFAGFERFDSGKVRFVEELSLILARTVFNIKVSERTRQLLEESQTMSSELQEKQEILRQNAEEMQATQEELQRSNIRLEEQVEEVNRTQNRMQLLLENASEVITIYEEDETIRYISPSVGPILGYTQNEMIGSADAEKLDDEHLATFKKMFKDLLENPNEQVTVQYEYLTKEGIRIWLESTGTNFMSNPAIHGIIINSRDITERRRAEQEQRMRSKMQALSENSPDLITRLEEGTISYINPIIEEYTGKEPANFLNRKADETELSQSILDRWLEIVEEVNATGEKVTSEMDFPSEMGNRVMQVNAIPEFDDDKNLESVLVVSHDITQRKLIELDVHNKNKKIADSINYAKRIQNAILPNNNVITRVLPDSFILYKPKDVVSGDFPWYVKAGDAIYLAAVDCTGHGVPGALLSLIGYFLLNDIVKSRKISDPGLILDQLDEGVTTTLRQDEDGSKTKDGMDIALCKIDTAQHTVEFSGAHRPLYVVKNGEMEEIKGNKFAIGGGIYKNQTNFTNHKIALAAGDSFFFCSDGFPDQFGGPNNRKFGPRRLRETIMEVHDQPMKRAYERFDNDWETWRGDEKQTDDVLLIGIKL